MKKVIIVMSCDMDYFKNHQTNLKLIQLRVQAQLIRKYYSYGLSAFWRAVPIQEIGPKWGTWTGGLQRKAFPRMITECDIYSISIKLMKFTLILIYTNTVPTLMFILNYQKNCRNNCIVFWFGGKHDVEQIQFFLHTFFPQNKIPYSFHTFFARKDFSILFPYQLVTL